MVCLLVHPPFPCFSLEGERWDGRGGSSYMIASVVLACLLSGGHYISVVCWSWAWHGGVETLKALKASARGWAVSKLCKLDHVFQTSLQLVTRGHITLMPFQFGPCPVVSGKPAALSLHSTISLLGPQAELDLSLFLLETGTLWSFVLSSCYLSSLWSRRAKKLTKQNASFPFLQMPRNVLKESLGVLRGLDRETFSFLSHNLSEFPCLLFHLFMMNSRWSGLWFSCRALKPSLNPALGTVELSLSTAIALCLLSFPWPQRSGDLCQFLTPAWYRGLFSFQKADQHRVLVTVWMFRSRTPAKEQRESLDMPI